MMNTRRNEIRAPRRAGPDNGEHDPKPELKIAASTYDTYPVCLFDQYVPGDALQ